MSAHPRVAADPDNPMKSFRHLGAKYLLLREAEATRMLAWIADAPGRGLTMEGLEDYAENQFWTRGYLRAIIDLARGMLAKASTETVEEARRRIAEQSNILHDEARAVGDYGPAVSALKLEAELLVPREDKHLHVHASLADLVRASLKVADVGPVEHQGVESDAGERVDSINPHDAQASEHERAAEMTVPRYQDDGL